jgi:Cu/Ag efflux protein CusF
MRFALILAIAMLLTPAAFTARAASGLQAQAATDLSAAKKKKAPKKAPKEEYLKAAPGTGPSGPKN